jgi:hypothetical protein
MSLLWMCILPQKALNLIKELCLPQVNPLLLEALQPLLTTAWSYKVKASLPILSRSLPR